jgi:hypothetical protein
VAAARNSQSEPIFPVSNFPAQHKAQGRSLPEGRAAKSPPSMPCRALGPGPLLAPPRHPEVLLLSRAGGFPKVPAPVSPVSVLFAGAFQRLLTARRKPGLCVVCLPAIGAFQRHSTQLFLHYRSSFCFHLLPCVPFTGAFQRLLPVPGSVPSGLVQRTGCSACTCGLGYPHSSCLGPVSFAGFLIKCTPRVDWY